MLLPPASRCQTAKTMNMKSCMTKFISPVMTVDMGATMAVMMFSLLPIIIVYLFCQKHIIKGVAAGAVKG